MLGLVDKSKLIHLLKHVFQGDEKSALKQFKEIFDEGLDAKFFLNDILELIYLFSRRINLGPIGKDLFISESELELIEETSKNLNTQDTGLFWQLTIKTIEDSAINKLRKIINEPAELEDLEIDQDDDFDKTYKGEISKSGAAILPSKRVRKIPEKIITKTKIENIEENKIKEEKEIEKDSLPGEKKPE